MKKYLIVMLFASVIQPLVFKAQNLAFKEHTKSQTAKTDWQPSIVDNNKGNILDGVEFYAKKGDCSSEEVTKLYKLVNTNNYQVVVSYQISPESQTIKILLPASATIEGSCGIIEGNLSKLSIKMPQKKEDREKINQYLLTHLTVGKY